MFIRLKRRRKLVSTIGIVVIALITTVMIPIGSAMWNETLQINGNLNTGVFGLTPPSAKPTFFPFKLTVSPSPTESPTTAVIPTKHATPTPFITDFTLETQIIVKATPTITPSRWPTQTAISPTMTKEPTIEPTNAATEILPYPPPMLADR